MGFSDAAKNGTIFNQELMVNKMVGQVFIIFCYMIIINSMRLASAKATQIYYAN